VQHDFCSLADCYVSSCHKMAFKEALAAELPPGEGGEVPFGTKSQHQAAYTFLPFI
jgi:hypothetical protein